jgi:hypothetical protein
MTRRLWELQAEIKSRRVPLTGWSGLDFLMPAPSLAERRAPE